MKNIRELADAIIERVHRLIIGQDEPLRELLAVFLAGGNALLEGYPGLGKTLIAKSIAQCLNLDFKRVQFTPDLMPADLLGTKIFDFQENKFVFIRGPLFTEVLLADEINRTPPKTQAALLEAMEEKHITIGGETFHLSSEFFVIATQNPLELEGTYPLPEAMHDRFWCEIVLNYPSPQEERAILERYEQVMVTAHHIQTVIEPIAGKPELEDIRHSLKEIRVEESIKNYLVDIATKTRMDGNLIWGLSPRAILIWLHVAKVWAGMEGRDYVIPDDIRRLAKPITRHRLFLQPEAQLRYPDVDTYIEEFLETVPVPK